MYTFLQISSHESAHFLKTKNQDFLPVRPTYHILPPSTHRVVYEGANCEYVADEFVVEEDILYYFRVAAVNDVGIGPYSISVSYTKRKACKY